MLMLLAIVWAADIFAFAVGNILKGPKLWPRFSPNKTWSGFLGGLAAAALAAMIVVAVAKGEGDPTRGWAAVIGLLVGLFTMGGDLWESMLKRRFGVKDSGQLIPGHGGLLDRVDGLMFGALAMAAARAVAHWTGHL
jgi:phosphatidate cytidylyltransferase